MAGPRIPQVLDLSFAVPATETGGAKSLIARQDGQVFDLVSARRAVVSTIIANQRPVSQEKGIVQWGVASFTSKTVNVVSVSGCDIVS